MTSGIPDHRFPRISLTLTALVFGGFGAFLFFRPGALESVGVHMSSPSGAVELRAFYGGMEIGLAVFFYLASTRRDWHRSALVAQILALGGLAIGRVLGVAIGGGADFLIWALASAEAGGAAVGILALRSLHSQRSTPEPARARGGADG